MFKRLIAGFKGAGRPSDVPGSIADALLARDIVNAIGPVLRTEQAVTWAVAAQIVEPAAMIENDRPQGPWVERWTFSADLPAEARAAQPDGVAVPFMITFTPDGRGGTDYLIEGQQAFADRRASA